MQRGTYPTAEYSFSSSYSVKEMPFLCKAIANARPPMPAPVKQVRGVVTKDSRVDGLTDDVAVFAIPGFKLEAYTSRIEVLSKANATLSKFHLLRRREIAAGATPTIKDSLAALAP